jgi:hypothetical protein
MSISYYMKALMQCLKEHGMYLETSQWNEAVENVGIGGLKGSDGVRKLGEVVYLCEDSDIVDVERHLSVLREVFPYLSFRRGLVEIEPEKGERDCDRDWKEMALLSGCDWFVIPNSTYSWWAATFSSLATRYVAGGSGGEIERGEVWVYYPSIWFGPSLAPTHDTRYLLNQKGWKTV